MTTKHGFELVREQEIPEYNTHAQIWRHIKTGAELLSLQNDDENKVFGITFRTPLENSNGVAHILEHAVLSGSRKYPVKEPFVELIKGSLNTFLNAFTFPDKTCYPIASQNVQDFYNLIDVYLDAVFYPLLQEHVFEQEGWHYELDNPTDPLIYKGIVFNEMKGSYASPDRVLGELAQHSIFPDTTYHVESGGHPRNIPDLTYDYFKNFHANYYHPSNSRIYFYGDDDADKRLELLNSWLDAFERNDTDSSIALQPHFDAPKRMTRTYAASGDSGEENKSMVAVSWLLTEPTDMDMALSLSILEQILVGTPAAPLRKALIESGLGEDIVGGLTGELRQMYFSTGLKGIAAEDVDAVEDLILATLQSLADKGIDPETVNAALSTLEFDLRENNTGSFPRGLSLMLRSLTSWLYDGDPVAPLTFEAPLIKIKASLAAGEPYFENLIRQFLIDNTHRTTVSLQPDTEQGTREAAEEKARLEAARAAMSEADLEEIVKTTQELKRLQETPDSPEALATIPSLSLTDLEKENKNIPLEIDALNGAKILYHDLFTNGITYFDIGFDLHTLSQDLISYVSLFGRALLEMGAGDEDFVQLSQRIGRDTGGIDPSLLASAVQGQDTATAWLFLRGKAMAPQTDKLLSVLRDVLLSPRFDNQERFRQIVLEEKAGEESRLASAGHQFVNARLRARYNEAGWLNEQVGGVSYIFFLRDLAAKIDSDWPAVLGALQTLHGKLINRNAALVNVTLDAENWAAVEPQVGEFLATLPAASVEQANWSVASGVPAEALVIPAQINYVGQAANLYDLGYKSSGSSTVIAGYLRTTWLWERVRVRGGAYGGFGLFDFLSGVWSFLSYRDPNFLPTLEVYKGTAGFLRESDLNEAALTSAIIGAIGTMDAYQLPDAKGWTSLNRYLANLSDEDRQRRRDEVLATTAEDFRAFGEVLAKMDSDSPIAVIGGQAAIEAANAEHPGWLKITPVM